MGNEPCRLSEQSSATFFRSPGQHLQLAAIKENAMNNAATPEEILDAYARLTPEEFAALLTLASEIIDGTDFESPLDLLHETLHQCLEGRYRWLAHGAWPGDREPAKH
jgi:hypothetical protein